MGLSAAAAVGSLTGSAAAWSVMSAAAVWSDWLQISAAGAGLAQLAQWVMGGVGNRNEGRVLWCFAHAGVA
jgi:hypothetical protein